MKCLLCSKTATVHLTDIVNKKKREMHLCDACAREKNLIPEPPEDLNVPALLQLVMAQAPTPARASAGDAICPECGMLSGPSTRSKWATSARGIIFPLPGM